MKTAFGKIHGWIIGLALAMWLPFLGGVHLFDWDEVNFAEIAREMLVSGDYFRPRVNFQPFWEKPPLFFWMQAASMKLFGVREFSARLPNVAISLVMLIALMRLGDFMSHHKGTGKYWALAYVGSILPHLYARSGIIDPWFNFFMFLGIVFYGFAFTKAVEIASFRLSDHIWALIAGCFIGLAVLTKGPVGYLIPVLVIVIEWLVRRTARTRLLLKHLVLITAATLVTTMLWFGWDLYKHGPWFLKTFTAYQLRLLRTPDAGHGGFFGYHVVVLLFGVFPASYLAIRSLIFRREIRKKNDTLVFNRLMSVTFWVVLVLFSIVKSKIVHYSSLAYFPLTYYAAYAIANRREYAIPAQPVFFIRWTGLFFGLLLVLLPLVGRHPEWLKAYVFHDGFARANLDAAVHWPWWTGGAGMLLWAVILLWGYRRRHGLADAYTWLFVGMALFMAVAISIVVPRVEAYTQRAAVHFYESKRGEDCYIEPVGFKTYAHLFYARVKKHENARAYDHEWLLRGPVDKPTYLVAKITGEDALRALPDASLVYRKNGFVFYRREAAREE